MLYYEEGNIVTGNYPIICQQVNCKGVMGAGLAKQIRDKYPQVYYQYKKSLAEGAKLGHISISYEYGIGGKIIISMFAQDGYGRDKQYTDYDAFKRCLDVMKWYADDVGGRYTTIAFPYGIGCGLAGGDWNVISKMLEEFSETVKQKIVIVKYEK